MPLKQDSKSSDKTSDKSKTAAQSRSSTGKRRLSIGTFEKGGGDDGAGATSSLAAAVHGRRSVALSAVTVSDELSLSGGGVLSGGKLDADK